MSALLYIILKSAKNSLRELIRKPGKLALYLLAAAGIVGIVILSYFTRPSAENQVPLYWFSGIFFLFCSFFVIIAIIKGTASGDTMFEMNDVNLLFVSPISPRKVLLYGILRLAKTSFLAGFFIIFQANSLANFGIGFDGVLLILLGFMTCIIVLTIASQMIYSLTNGNARRKILVKLIACAMFLPLVAVFAISLLRTGDAVDALQRAIQSPCLTFVPFAGWTAAGITRLLFGNLLPGLLLIGANLFVALALVTAILLSRQEYYEDTLVATETAFQKKRAASEGNINLDSSTKKVSVVKTGISGSGAAALFGKHLRESFRQNRLGFLNLASCLMIVSWVALIFFVKDMVMAIQILMWIQIFLIGTGRGLKETYSHYIYMIPESSLKKILWSNMEVMIKTLIESILIFGIGGMAAQANGLVILCCIVAYTLFSLLLLSINYLSMRFTGANISMGLLIIIYYFSVVIAMVPGVMGALVVGFGIGGVSGTIVGLLILSAWELAAGLACFALSRGVLHRCDMATGKPKG